MPDPRNYQSRAREISRLLGRYYRPVVASFFATARLEWDVPIYSQKSESGALRQNVHCLIFWSCLMFEHWGSHDGDCENVNEFVINKPVFPSLSQRVKVKLSRNKLWRLREGCNVRLPSLLWRSAQSGRQSCQLYVPVALYPQGSSLVYALLLEAQWTPGLLNAGRRKDPTRNRIRSLRSCGACLN
jgi:hypothetical protein